jgi:hypothetical protein
MSPSKSPSLSPRVLPVLLVLTFFGPAAPSRAALAEEPAATAESDSAEAAEVGKVEFHGYGDFQYNNPKPETMSRGAANQIDLRAIELAWEYGWTPALRAEVEVEFEHAGEDIELEEAMLEYDLAHDLSLRAGALVMPVGRLNEAHDPTLYYSVLRPYVEQIVIPTTWQEGGAGIAGGEAGDRFQYRAYVTEGLDATGFSSLYGIRDGVTHSEESKASDLAGAGRIVVGPARGLSLGASGYYGGADQRTPGLGKVSVTLLDADARFQRGGADLRGAFVWTSIDGADRVSTLLGQTVGRRILGSYLEAAYEVLGRGRALPGGRALYVFARAERIDTNNSVPAGFRLDPAADRRILTGGISYYPVDRVAFKADLEHWSDDADATLDRFNLAACYLF